MIFGIVIADLQSDPDPDPLGPLTETADTGSTTTADESGADAPSVSVARSNARFTLRPEVDTTEADELDPSSTTAAPVRRSTTTRAPTTAAPTTEATSTTTSSTVPEPSTSTTKSTIVDPPGKPTSTTVDDGETTTTKKCRGNRPECRKP